MFVLLQRQEINYNFHKNFDKQNYNCYFAVLKTSLMLKNVSKIIGLLVLILSMNCARRGTITGGLKDSLAPVVVQSLPKNFSTNFKGKIIKISFDEYVKIKNLNKQLIVSPPMKNQIEVTPYTASKELSIKIRDTLKPNTTYSFNFGNSIEDNNENNPLKQFKFVFSTGAAIDSLKLSVNAKDAFERKVTNFVSVFLYEITEKYNDSVVYKQLPRYVANTLDSLKTVTFENLREGKYRLVAVKDLNSNNKFDPKTEKIGFVKEFVSVPNEGSFELKLFKETLPFKIANLSQVSGNKLIAGFEGDYKDLKTEIKKNNQKQDFIITKFPKKDSLQIWIKAQKNDSLNFEFSKNKYEKKFAIKFKNQKKDTLQFTAEQSDVVLFRDDYTIDASRPLSKFDISKMVLLNKDSVSQKFKMEYDDWNQKVKIIFEKQELEKYKLKIFPGAITDFYDTKNDSLIFKFSTKRTSDYGNLRVKLENVKRFPIILQITNQNGELIASQSSDKNTALNFDLVEPNKFVLRLIYDDNNNGIWDSGSFLQLKQPEEVVYFPNSIDVRANWDWEQIFDLK